MIYKIICFLLSSLSLFTIFYSNKDNLYSSAYNTTNNLDVYFTDAYTVNNTKLTTNKTNINIDQINLKHPGDYEIIKYTGLNNSNNIDVDIDVYINGVKSFNNEYFTITCSKPDTVKSKDTFTGEIKIELNKAVVENKKLDFNIELQVKRIS